MIDLIHNFTWETSNYIFDNYSNIIIPIYLIYLPLVYSIQSIMKKFDAFHLKVPLFLWNMFLGTFSLISFLAMVYTWKSDFDTSIISLSYNKGVSGFVTMAFCLSKVLELIDTLFIVLRKKKLLTLHTYHHFVTGLYCWFVLKDPTSMGLWFTTMNLFVHAIMYLYYAFMCLKIKIFP